MTEMFLSFLITSAVGTLLALLLIILRIVTKKFFSASWNYYVWLVVLLVMMVPFKFNLPEKEGTLVTVQVTEVKDSENIEKQIVEVLPQISEDVVKSEVLAEKNMPDSSMKNYEPKRKNSTPVFQTVAEFLKNKTVYFAQVWIVGAVLLFILKIASYKKFLENILKNSRQVPCEEIEKYTDEKIEVRVSKNTQSPFVIRWLKPVLVLPDREITKGEMENILAHEMTHIKRHDILYKWFVGVVKCVHWFNPFIYYIARQIDVECEISCDAQAVKNMSTEERWTYAETILSLLTDKGKRVALTTGMSGDKKTLKKRFEMIKNSKMTTKRLMVVSVVLIAVILSVTVLVSGVLNGELFGEEPKRRIPVSESEEETGLNIVNEKDLNINPYDEIIEKYFKALDEKWNAEKVDNEGLSAALYDCALFGYTSDEPLLNIGYIMADINNDGVNELLIGELGETPIFSNDLIWDMYTIEKSKAVRVLESGGKHLNFLVDDEKGGYIIATEDTYGATCAYFYYNVLNGSKLETVETVAMDYMADSENPCFRETSEGVVYIDEDEAIDIINEHRKKYVTPKFIPFETLKEEAVSVSEEESQKIIEKFYAADDFWIDWMYGQSYVTDRMSNSQNLYYGAVNEESPVQSKSELKKAMEEHFTKSLAEKFMRFLNPEDINGKLYIAYRDVGGPYDGIENIVVEKLNSRKYRLSLEMRNYIEEVSDPFFKYVEYVFEDGRWVFDNGDGEEYFYHRQKHENIEYLPVLKKYYLALSEKWDVTAIDYDISNIIAYRYDGNPLENIGYSLMDINKDGQNELLIGVIKPEGLTEEDIYDLYTVKDGRAHRLAVGGYRDRYFLSLDDNGEYLIKERTSGGGLYQTARTYRMNNTELEFVEGVVYDAHSYSVMPWFKVSEDGYEYDESISEETYDGIIETYEDAEKIVYPKYVPFETLD